MCNPTNPSNSSEKKATADDTTNLTETIQQESVSTPITTTPKPSVPTWYSKLKVHEKSLEDQSNWFSDIFLFYLSPLLRLGAMKVLVDEDIGVPTHEDEATQTFERISKAWKYQIMKAEQLNKKRKAIYDAKRSKLSDAKKALMPPFVPSEPGVATALMVSFGVWRILWAILLYTLSALLGFVPVILLKGMLNII